MSKFRPIAQFERPLEDGYRLLPFNFTHLDADRYVLTNAVGEHVLADRPTLERFVNHELAPSTGAYAVLKTKHFLMDATSDVAIDLLTLKTRTKYARLPDFTALHIFVVSLRCEHSCPYCQVSRQSDDRLAFDMSVETADKALDLVFKSPSPVLKIEFQGGESMLNFELVRHIVERAEALNAGTRRLEFVIATNLAVATDDILEYCRDHEILISTSLDGPADLHNANRPRKGRDSYERAIAGIRRAREIVGRDRVSALMTTTQASLPRVRDIVDEYVAQNFHEVFLRPLSPYGFALKTKLFAAYDVDEWLRFYFDGLAYILDLNRRGIFFRETFSSIVLEKMLTPFGTGYVDLTSPAGIGTGVLVYNYDGDVYASDESRMLAEMGDKTFRIGNVHADSWEQIVTAEPLLDALERSYTGSAPMCSQCAFEPFCGAEPVFHYATQGDVVGHKPSSLFCRRNLAIFRRLASMLDADGPDAEILRSWVRV